MNNEFQEWFMFCSGKEDLAMFRREGDLLIVKTSRWSKTRPDTTPFQPIPRGYEDLHKDLVETLVTIDDTEPYYTKHAHPSIEVIIPRGFKKTTTTTWRIRSWTDR